MMKKQHLLQISEKFRSSKAVPAWMKKDLTLAQQIRALREALGMTQQQLAGKVGMHQGDIANIEEGRRKDLRVSTLQRIAEALQAEMPLFLIPKEEIAGLIERKALEKAKKLVASTSANMAMELQKPDSKILNAQVTDLKEEIIRKRRSILWEDHGEK